MGSQGLLSYLLCISASVPYSPSLDDSCARRDPVFIQIHPFQSPISGRSLDEYEYNESGRYRQST